MSDYIQMCSGLRFNLQGVTCTSFLARTDLPRYFSFEEKPSVGLRYFEFVINEVHGFHIKDWWTRKRRSEGDGITLRVCYRRTFPGYNRPQILDIEKYKLQKIDLK